MLADSLQAAVDTVVVVNSQPNTWLDWFSLAGTAAVALFTGGYLLYTSWIYEETKKQAESAEESAEASQEAAKASVRSNIITKRQGFYPIFGFNVGFVRDNIHKLKVEVSLLNKNMIFRSRLFALFWYDEGYVREGESEGHFDIRRNISDPPVCLLTKVTPGNITESEVCVIDTRKRAYSVDFLFEFQDAIGNVYYRNDKININDGPTAETAGTITTEMEPSEAHSIYLGEEGFFLCPFRLFTEDVDGINYTDVQSEAPEPVSVFNDVAHTAAVGTFGDVVIFSADKEDEL